MAKKDTVYIDIETSDGGSMQRVAVSAKKLGLALDDVGGASGRAGKGSASLDRNMKGLSKQSSNSTKNFSKMAQGMTGTLVPAYAVLASNVFAITAAFQFLKQAADFRVMQEAQVAFTGATGVGMKSLTANIQEASGMMLEFKDASEAASIGIASGLGAGQIEQLAAGAGNLSKILGRDVTDSFNRLIRGVTKAEPELLDELGIILRLEDAQKNYATSLNKAAADLTNYEKKQAVFLEVQTQLESKYGGVAKATSIQVNAIARLGTEFDRILNKVKKWTAALAEPAAEFLTKNILSLTAALGLMAIPIIRSIIPGLDSWAEKSRDAAEAAANSYKEAQEDLEELAEAEKRLKKGDTGAVGASKVGGKAKKGSGLEMLQQGDTETLKADKRRVSQMLRHAEQGNGVVRKMNKRQKADYLAMLRGMKRGHNTWVENIGMGYRRMTDNANLQFKKMAANWKATMASMKTIAANGMGKIDKVFRAAGWVGMIIMFYDLAKTAAQAMGFFKDSKDIENYVEAFGNIGEKLKTVGEEYKKFEVIQKRLAKAAKKDNTGYSIKSLQNQGNFFTGITPSIIDAAQAMADYKNEALMAAAGIEEFTKHQKLADLEDRAHVPKGEVQTKEVGTGKFKDGPLGGRVEITKEVTIKALDDIERAEMNALQKQKERHDLWVKDLAKLTKANKALADSMKAPLDTAIKTIKAIGPLSVKQKEYLDILVEQRRILDTGETLTQKQIDALKNLAEGFAETGRKAGFVLEQEKELKKQYTDALNSISKYSTSVSSLQKLLEDQKTTLKELAEANEGDPLLIKEIDKSTQQLNKYLKVLDDIARVEIRIANEKIQNQRVFNKALHTATALQKEDIARSQKIVANNQKIALLQNEITVATEHATDKEKLKLDGLKAQVLVLQEQNDLIREQRDLNFQIRQAGEQALEKSLQSNIAAIMKGEETSLKDALLNIAKSVTDSMIDAFAKNLTGKIMNAVGFETEAQKNARLLEKAHKAGGLEVQKNITKGAKEVSKEAEAIAKALEDGTKKAGEAMTKALDDAAQRFAQAIRDACASCTCAGAGMEAGIEKTLPVAPDLPRVESRIASSSYMDQFNDGPPGKLSYMEGGEGDLAGSAGHLSTFGDGAGATPVPVVLKDSAGMDVALPTAVDAALGDETGGFNSLRSGDGTTDIPSGGGPGGEDPKDKNTEALEKNSAMTLKTAMGLGMAVTALAGNSKAGQALQKIMAAIYLFDQVRFVWERMRGAKEDIALGQSIGETVINTTATMGNTAALMGSGVGGIAAKGLYPPLGYAAGGVAKGPKAGYPAILHGNEAVVPLPNGKDIPVTFPKGAGGSGTQNNTVGITVNIDNQGQASTDTESDDQEAEALGERLAFIVQEELVNQKRAGGLLSPYGAS
jgi:hypothetical protein